MKIKLPKISLRKSEETLHKEKLIEQYENGMILQVNNGINNKDYLNSRKTE